MNAKTRYQYWPFFALIMLLLASMSALLVWNQHQNDVDLNKRLVRSHFAVIEAYVQHALDRGNYDAIQPLFDTWNTRESQTYLLELRGSNGFVLARYQAEEKPFELIRHQATLNYGYGREAYLTYQQGLNVYPRLAQTAAIVLFALLIVLLFGLILIRHSRRLDLLSRQLEQRNSELHAEQSLLQSVIDSLPDLIYFKSIEGVYRGCNREFCVFYDVDSSSVKGQTDIELFNGTLAQFSHDRDLAVIRSQHPIRGESRITSAAGEDRLMDTAYTPYFDPQDKLLGLIGIYRDITDLRRVQENLEKLAYHDSLTGLPNRLYLTDRMQKDMAQTHRRNTKLAICTIDLDGFKPINDSYGHDVGDRVLIQLASKINSTLRSEDTVARWGGDEFTLLLNNLEDPAYQIPTLIERVQQAINRPVVIDKAHTARLTSSIGITIYPDDDQDADTLLRHADQAMYISKQQGKDQYTIFDSETDRSLHDAAQSISDLFRAIEENQLVLFFQPQISLDNGSIHGVEALVRWQHPEKGMLSPVSFLPPAENHTANIKLDDWVMQAAIAQLNIWLEQSYIPLVSINLSGASLLDPAFPDRLSQLLERYPDCADHLKFEILESSLLEDLERVTRIIEQCSQQGIRFALDDFGTGYSSMTYLRRLPAEYLKIDKSFVIDMLNDPDDMIIVDGIINLGRAFSKQVIAEGVETIQHGEHLRNMGAQILQGFAIARPMPADKLEGWHDAYEVPQQWSTVEAPD